MMNACLSLAQVDTQYDPQIETQQRWATRARRLDKLGDMDTNVL